MTRTNFSMVDQVISMVRGDTLSFGVQIEDQTGALMDIESAYFACKKSYLDDENIFKKTLGDGITKAETGKYIVRVAPEDTAEVEAGQYFYELRVGDNSDVFTILKGVINIEMDIT